MRSDLVNYSFNHLSYLLLLLLFGLFESFVFSFFFSFKGHIFFFFYMLGKLKMEQIIGTWKVLPVGVIISIQIPIGVLFLNFRCIFISDVALLVLDSRYTSFGFLFEVRTIRV